MSNQPQLPEISVLIPTRNRPELVKRAIASVQAQTFTNYEIVVTIDGPDSATEEALALLGEPRLRWIVHPENRGLPSARLTGIENAQAEWIAYLDDDDEWMPEKLEKQLAVARSSSYPYPVVMSRLIGRTSKGDFVWPRRSPQASEPIGDYLFIRKSFLYGEALLQPSTWLLQKELLLKVLPDTSLERHEDWNWLLNAVQIEGVGIEFVEEALSVWYRPAGNSQLSKNTKWDYSLSWIRSVKHLLTPKAYAGFIMSIVGSKASLQGQRDQFWPLLSESLREGPPGTVDLLLYVMIWVMPSELRTNIRNFLVNKVIGNAKAALSLVRSS